MKEEFEENEIFEELAKQANEENKKKIEYLKKLIGQDILDIDINKVLELKLKALIDEQAKYDTDDYGVMRILVDDISIVEYLYFYLKTSATLNLFDKEYFVVKLEFINTGENFVYLKDWSKLKA